jgi:squalene synthase HpnC
MDSGAIETPSGKGSGDENFPVGSWLLAPQLRPHVATFYALARAADDIADNGALAADDKVRRLASLRAALLGEARGPGHEKAERMRESLRATGVTPQHCVDLLAAFTQDATKLRYTDWDDLMGYCYLSASPVGRYLLDLHGEDRAAWPASDALCNALQVLNHLQDCRDDYLNLNRVYLPQDWMAAFGTSVEELDRPRASPAMRRVLDRTLDGVAGLMVSARTLPARLKSKRLAMESAVIVALADRLMALLRRGDPIAGRVALTKGDFAMCGVRGALRGLVA